MMRSNWINSKDQKNQFYNGASDHKSAKKKVSHETIPFPAIRTRFGYEIQMFLMKHFIPQTGWLNKTSRSSQLEKKSRRLILKTLATNKPNCFSWNIELASLGRLVKQKVSHETFFEAGKFINESICKPDTNRKESSQWLDSFISSVIRTDLFCCLQADNRPGN